MNTTRGPKFSFALKDSLEASSIIYTRLIDEIRALYQYQFPDFGNYTVVM